MQCVCSVKKLLARNIGTTERREHETSFVYPSITMCPSLSRDSISGNSGERTRDNLTQEYQEIDPLDSRFYYLHQLSITTKGWARNHVHNVLLYSHSGNVYLGPWSKCTSPATPWRNTSRRGSFLR